MRARASEYLWALENLNDEGCRMPFHRLSMGPQAVLARSQRWAKMDQHTGLHVS